MGAPIGSRASGLLLISVLVFCLSGLADTAGSADDPADIKARDARIKVTRTPIPGVPLEAANIAPIPGAGMGQPVGRSGHPATLDNPGGTDGMAAAKARGGIAPLPADRVETVVKEPLSSEAPNRDRSEGEPGDEARTLSGVLSLKVPLNEPGQALVAPNPLYVGSGMVYDTIPDLYSYWRCVNWTGDPLPTGAVVTNVEYRMYLGPPTPDHMYCADYEINIFSGAASRENLVYDNLGGRTDGGYDDDPDDDEDIYLNWRSTSYFNGEDPDQCWGVWIDDLYQADYCVLNYFEFQIYWQVPLPNLTSYTPSGWDGPIVASSVPGTNTDGPNLMAGDTTYIDWAVMCYDAEVTETFYTYLYVDGGYAEGWYTYGLSPGWYAWVQDYPHVFSPGVHNLCTLVDALDAVAESDETDNQYCKEFTWQQDLDWGDAPDPTYPTLAVSNGASHVIYGPWLGDASDAPDFDADGQPSPTAVGDDLDGNDDEDGVEIPELIPGAGSTINVEISDGGSGTGGVLEAWIDFDHDGSWSAAEKFFDGWLPAGVHGIGVTTPPDAVLGQTFGRFRVSLNGGLGPDGPAPDGEVEDHQIWIVEEQVFKWLQPPDFDTTGIDVEATDPYILGDDYLCTETGRITEIWVWASWRNDYLPSGEDPGAVDFVVSFRADIPADENPDRYSIPGETLWERDFMAGDFEVIPEADDLREGWLVPPEEYWWPGDTVCWLYRFYVPVMEAFFQYGSPDDPIVYWLVLRAYPRDPEAVFGWKTSTEHWNDDAVWGQGGDPYPGPWLELRYPPEHPYATESIDLAFMLVRDPESGVPGRDETEGFGLYPNEPNPFSHETRICYSLAESGPVKLEVFDVMGRVVATLADGEQVAGPHFEVWRGVDDRGRQVPAGIYFSRLTAGRRTATEKMLYLK